MHGGLVGKIQYGTIDNCVNTASVTGNGNEHGGLVGYLNDGTIKNCFNAGVVEGTKKVGSIVGGHNDGKFTDNYHTTATTGGIGANNSNIGTDQPGAEVVAKITADTGVTLVLPAVPAYSWNEENLYKNGTVVTLNYAVPDGKVFDHYTVNNGAISDAGIMEGDHTLTAKAKDEDKQDIDEIDGSWQEFSFTVKSDGTPLYVNISNWTQPLYEKLSIDHMEWIPEGSDVPVEPGPGDEREFSSLAFSGDSLFLSFPDADERFSYVLRGTNDLVAPMPWPALFSTNGTGSITIETKILPGEPCMFYYLETTAK